MNKTFAVSVSMMLAAVAWGHAALPDAACSEKEPCQGEVAYISIVRDHNGKVTEKTVGALEPKVDNPAFRVAAVGCLFAQLQDEDVIDPDQLVTNHVPGFKSLTLREAMVNPAGHRFVSDIVEPCIEKITGKKVDDLLVERFWKPLGICGGRAEARQSNGGALSDRALPSANRPAAQPPTTNPQPSTPNPQLPAPNSQLTTPPLPHCPRRLCLFPDAGG